MLTRVTGGGAAKAGPLGSVPYLLGKHVHTLLDNRAHLGEIARGVGHPGMNGGGSRAMVSVGKHMEQQLSRVLDAQRWGGLPKAQVGITQDWPILWRGVACFFEEEDACVSKCTTRCCLDARQLVLHLCSLSGADGLSNHSSSTMRFGLYQCCQL